MIWARINFGILFSACYIIGRHFFEHRCCIVFGSVFNNLFESSIWWYSHFHRRPQNKKNKSQVSKLVRCSMIVHWFWGHFLNHVWTKMATLFNILRHRFGHRCLHWFGSQKGSQNQPFRHLVDKKNSKNRVVRISNSFKQIVVHSSWICNGYIINVLGFGAISQDFGII